jgi:hypothetical protein
MHNTKSITLDHLILYLYNITVVHSFFLKICLKFTFLDIKKLPYFFSIFFCLIQWKRGCVVCIIFMSVNMFATSRHARFIHDADPVTTLRHTRFIHIQASDKDSVTTLCYV